MSDAEFWATFALLGIAGVFVLLLLAAICKTVEWLFRARDMLRERYFGERVEVNAMDLILVPVWFVVEITALVVGLVIIILLAWAAQDAARGFRDWWHAGDRSR
ncbi:MAG: hypothetical protein L6Q69_01665 [Zoogloea sp.]|jgi:putative exporter of polyketide antibiotics|nr:hypothetical protein [Zoogloea sp.]